MTPLEQARVFGVMLLTGVGLGAVYDLLAPLRRGVGCAAADLLFGICCAAGVIAAALYVQSEVFRIYTFAGAACGMAVYALSLGRIVRLLAGICQKMWKKG